MTPRVRVVPGDVVSHACDVLVLKYAQARYGADEAVAAVLEAAGQSPETMAPRPGGYRLIETHGTVPARYVMFEGVPDLRAFGYGEVRSFATKALEDLAGRLESARAIAFTSHGTGYGLDERESFGALVAGILDAVRTGDVPRGLTDVEIIERNPGRARRFDSYLDEFLGTAERDGQHREGTAAQARLENIGTPSDAKPHIFVAMPFDASKDDHFHYGIQNAAHAASYLCERMDFLTFTGDVMEKMKERIASAELVVADLSGANPNVYLEVGFAWGSGVPTVLVIDSADDLKFDVQGQRCLTYSSIQDLETKLSTELRGLEG